MFPQYSADWLLPQFSESNSTQFSNKQINSQKGVNIWPGSWCFHLPWKKTKDRWNHLWCYIPVCRVLSWLKYSNQCNALLNSSSHWNFLEWEKEDVFVNEYVEEKADLKRQATSIYQEKFLLNIIQKSEIGEHFLCSLGRSRPEKDKTVLEHGIKHLKANMSVKSEIVNNDSWQFSELHEILNTFLWNEWYCVTFATNSRETKPYVFWFSILLVLIQS